MGQKLLIFGLGYVGLALLREVALSSDLEVTGYDPDKVLVDEISQSNDNLPIRGVNVGFLEKANCKLVSTVEELDTSDIYVICVPTPLADSIPDLSMLQAAGKTISRLLKKNDLVILESTSYPGTTEQFLGPILESTGLKIGIDFSLAFSSERVDPGNSKYGLKNTPKVIGGVDAESTRKADLFYRKFVNETVLVKGTREAELSKLIENTYRFINISFINELESYCHKLGIDILEAITAASTKPFGFQAFYPGPGIGGHCIPVDPLYLSSYIKNELDTNFRFIELSNEVNFSRPKVISSRILDYLNELGGDLEKKKILLIGIGYKANTSDTRMSPVFGLMEELYLNGIQFDLQDNCVRTIEFKSKKIEVLRKTPANLKDYVMVVILQKNTDLKVSEIEKSGIKIMNVQESKF